MLNKRIKASDGFTIVELLIVIVIIAILATLSFVAFNGVQDKARFSKMKADQQAFAQAIMLAQENTGQKLIDIDGNGQYGNGGEAAACSNRLPSGTDLATLAKSDPCWLAYNSFLTSVSAASGVNIKNLLDPWGRPYFIDEERGCGLNQLSAFTYPFTGWGQFAGMNTILPANGYTGC